MQSSKTNFTQQNIEKINIVWLKRDIRSQDHLPLHEAEQAGLPYLIIYIFEPSIISYPDTSLRHLQFQYHSLLNLNQKLRPFNRQVQIYHAEAVEVFSSILDQFEVRHIFSYQESGIQITYNRDKAVSSFCADNNIEWRQFQRDGIIRGLKNRKDWDKKWYMSMHSLIIQNEFSFNNFPPFKNEFPLRNELLRKLENYPSDFQPPGEDFAIKYLTSFVHDRGKNYSRHISKPTESRKSCIRISPYLSWGNISIRQAYQFIYNSLKNSNHSGALKNSLTRLKWHCHFIQKFEVECSYELQCINAGYEMLEHQRNENHIAAWKNAQTGFPLVDACMVCLQKTGWLNFRMRAMLVSFFCHHLYQDWRAATYHLAQLFLDYEPGIHYPQFQMQAGTTGINTIRIYNPVKQSQDHDPEGIFIKTWLPQLQNVPVQFIHEPHKMSLFDQQFCGVYISKDYPAPIVDIDISGKNAREKIWSHRKNDLVKQESIRILNTHTRKSSKSENIS